MKNQSECQASKIINIHAVPFFLKLKQDLNDPEIYVFDNFYLYNLQAVQAF